MDQVCLWSGPGRREPTSTDLAAIRLDEAVEQAAQRVRAHLAQLEGARDAEPQTDVTGGVPPKTAASVRTIPLPQVVVEALAAYIRDHPPGANRLVFTPENTPISRQAFGHIWRPPVAAAGLPSLRHYFASLLIRRGESVKTVQSRLGHASPVETLDTYALLWPDSDDRTREAINSVLGPAADYLRTERASDRVPQVRGLRGMSWPVGRVLSPRTSRCCGRRPSI